MGDLLHLPRRYRIAFSDGDRQGIVEDGGEAIVFDWESHRGRVA